MRVYLDTCCYNRPYDDQTQLKISLEAQAKLYIQEKIRKGELELVSLGVIETERFISVIMKEKFDYTKWRKTALEDVSVCELNRQATQCAENHQVLF